MIRKIQVQTHLLFTVFLYELDFALSNLVSVIITEGYTSISVREPLANIIAQTKSAQQQRQATRPITDPHYATVSDDSGKLNYYEMFFVFILRKFVIY